MKRDYKAESQKQWDGDPCGAVTAEGLVPGTPEFFARIESERYVIYAPWMREAMGFGAYAGKRVLEIGPGLGTDHAQFARAGARMFALDLARRHLELTRQHFSHEGLVTRPVHSDAERLPFPDASFDVVYSFGVFHHTPDTNAAVSEVHRVLRPSGVAIVGLYHRHSAFFWVRTILVRGVLRGRLVNPGYRRILAEIEHRAPGSDAVPLVKVYSRSECRRLFSTFSEARIRTDHIDLPHCLPPAPPTSGAARRRLERLGRRWGWYVTVTATK